MSKFGGYDDQPLLAEIYDFVPPYRERGDVDFYLDFARRVEGRVLELGCGTGRILIPTARAGCEITGIDISEHMLAKCREKLEKEPPDVQKLVQLVQADITGFSLNDMFSLVTTPFRPFQHLLSVEEQFACLCCANRHLEMAGTLILDLYQVNLRFLCNPASKVDREDFADVELSDGRKLRRTSRIVNLHRAKQYNDVEMVYYVTYSNGRVEKAVQTFPFRYFFRYEVEHLLARCGFTVTDVFGNFDKSPLTDGSPEMIFIATKERNVNRL